MPSRHKSPACADYVPALCTHRPSLLPIEWLSEAFGLTFDVGKPTVRSWKVSQTWSFRGSKSRNKVSVGEPAEGSLPSTGPYPLPGGWGPRPPTLVDCTVLLRRARHGWPPGGLRMPPPGLCPPETPSKCYCGQECCLSLEKLIKKLSTMDLLVPASMKNAAKCDK